MSRPRPGLGSIPSGEPRTAVCRTMDGDVMIVAAAATRCDLLCVQSRHDHHQVLQSSLKLVELALQLPDVILSQLSGLVVAPPAEG